MRTFEQQVPGIKRTNLQRHDLSVPGREVVQSRVDIDPSAPLFKHTHPGEEIIYVLEGALEYQIEDKPPMTFNAGDVLTVPAGTIHAVRNVGSGNAAELAHVCRRKREAAPHAGPVSASRFIFLLGGSDGEQFVTGDHDEPGEKRPHDNCPATQ